MNIFKEQGVVESEGEDEEGGKNYDRGIEMIHSIKKKIKRRYSHKQSPLRRSVNEPTERRSSSRSPLRFWTGA